MDRRTFIGGAAALATVVTTTGGAAAATAGTVRLQVVGRSAWGARPMRAGARRHRPVRLTLHHSGDHIADHAEGAAIVRGIQHYHQSLGHPDIDYHYLIDREGMVYRGRPARYRGDTQTEYDPTGHFLVCCLGDYQQQRPTDAMLRSLVRLFAYASHRWHISPGTIAGHRDVASTDCPGVHLERLVRSGRLERRVADLGTRRTVELTPAHPR